MKKRKLTALSTVATMVAALAAAADTVTFEDVTYTILDAGVAPVEVSVGTGTDGSPAVDAATDFTVEIPETFEIDGVEYKVVSVGAYAFSGCKDLKTVILPDSVWKIGKHAFAYNTTLENVVIGKGVSHIQERAFQQCSALKSIVLPDSLTRIDEYAFRMCTGLEEITIPPNVGMFRKGVFTRCYALTNIVISEGVAAVPDDTFSSDTYDMRVKSVTIPASVTNVSASAFGGRCKSIETLTIPQCVVDTGITNIFHASASSITDVTLVGVTNVTSTAFAGLVNLKSLAIRDGDAHIEEGAFAECKAIENVSIPPGVTGVKFETFAECQGLWAKIYNSRPDVSYDLASGIGDRTIASVTVDSDVAIDAFVLKDGKAYDTVLRVENTADSTVTLSLPEGFTYETFYGTHPLDIPARSTNLITITRTRGDTFLVSRRKLKTL